MSTMHSIAKKMGIIALKTSYEQLPWYKKIFFPWQLAWLLTEKRALLTNSKENAQYASKVYEAYANSWYITRMIFSSLKFFSNNPVVRALDTLRDKACTFNYDQFVFMSNHDNPEEFANKIIAVSENKFYKQLDENPDQIEDWVAAGVDINEVFLRYIVQEKNDKAEQLISMVDDKKILEQALLKTANLKLFKMILNEAGDSIKTGHLASILLNAIGRNWTDIALELIKKPGKIDFQDTGGNTPLHWAAASNRIRIVEALLNANANIDIMNSDGYTPYMIAKAKNHEECAEKIAEKNPEINVKSWASEVNKIRVKQNEIKRNSDNCYSFHHHSHRERHKESGLERFVTEVFHLR